MIQYLEKYKIYPFVLIYIYDERCFHAFDAITQGQMRNAKLLLENANILSIRIFAN